MTNLPYTQTSDQPYVKLKSGARYNSSSAERHAGLLKDKIELGDTSFKTKDVAFYATGGNTYANIGRKTFATQVAAGKINLYKYEFTTTTYRAGNSGPGGMGPMGNGMGVYDKQKHIRYYIQKNEDAPVMPLSYRFLQPMVQTGTPEFNMLEKYRKTRVVTRAMGYGSLGLIAGGIALNYASSNTSVQGAGASMFGAGFFTGAGWLVATMIKQHKLLKTVIIADKISKKKGRHELVKY